MNNKTIYLSRLVLLSLTVISLLSCGTPNGAIHNGSHTRSHIQISGGSSAGALNIERIELTDSKGLTRVNISKNEQLYPLAKIKYTGLGVLSARWTLDGRVIEQVNVSLNKGSLLLLTLKKSTIIPAFTSGSHVLKLHITQPVISFNQPVLNFFVNNF